jgi:hypothetical protein
MTHSPLEQFLFSYTEAIGGIWDEVEPQVFDVLLPENTAPMRLTFDPDALAEHPNAQFFTFGSAALDDFLLKAREQGQVAEVYLQGAHLPSQNGAYWEQRIKREISLPPESALHLDSVRPMTARHTLFWFEITYLSDEKEQGLAMAAIDRVYGRQTRYLDSALREAGEAQRDFTLSEERTTVYPTAPEIPLSEAYLLARGRILRTLVAEANSKRSEMESRVARQTRRMNNYFQDLRDELQTRIERAQQKIAALHVQSNPQIEPLAQKASVRKSAKSTAALTPAQAKAQAKAKAQNNAQAKQTLGYSPEQRAAMEAELREEIASLQHRMATLHREEFTRVDDVRKKSVLRVFIRLVNYLHVQVPRLFFQTELISTTHKQPQFPATSLTISFDGITDRFDALTCPRCKTPTFKLVALTGANVIASALGCPSCPPLPSGTKR